MAERGVTGGAAGPGAGGRRRGVHHRPGRDGAALRGVRRGGRRQRPGGAEQGRGVPARPAGARRDAAGRRRDRGVRPAAARRHPGAGGVPHRPRRHRGQDRWPHRRRRRLRHQAVQPRGADRPGAGGTAAHPAGRSPRPARLRRPGDRRGRPPGQPRRRAAGAAPDRVQAAALPGPERGPGAVQGADPRPRLELRLRRQRQRRRDLRQLPAPQGRPPRPAADPDRQGRRLRAAPAGELKGREAPVSLRVRLVATLLVLVLLGLAVADVCTYVVLRSFLLDRVDRQVKTVTDLVEVYAASPEARRTHFFDPSVPTMFGQDSGDTTVFRFLAAGGVAPSFLQLRYPDNRVMKTLSWEATAPRLPAILPVSTSPGAGPDGAVAFTVPSKRRGDDRHGGGEWRVRAVRLPGSGGYLLAMATPTKDVQETLGHLRQIEAAVGLLVLLGVALLARRAVRRGMRPLEEIGATARAIGAGELDRRVEPTDARTEVGRLGVALNAMLHQLETAFQRRQASEERLRRFVADASHELRTPLTSIRGYAELFRRGASANPDDLAKAMRRIEAEAARMGALVDELLLLARLDQGRPLERAPVDLAVLAADAVADARAVEPERPVTLERDGPVVVDGDADRLRQVLANLIANVWQHTPPATPMRVRACLDDQGRTAVLEVADDGPGLAGEQRERVFERFWRADRSRPRAGENGRRHGGAGAGLGLSIVAAVAAAHGGRATVESVPGQGTTFRIELPLDGPLDRRTATSKVPHRLLEGAVGEVGPASPTDHQEERGAMATLSRFVLRHKRLVGLFWLAVLVAGLAGSSRVSSRLSTSEFSLPGEKSYQAALAITRLYGNGGNAKPLVPVVILPAGTTVDSPGVKQALARS